ncbi:MAG: S41 family peptidase [Armatimonadaceae bacterium]
MNVFPLLERLVRWHPDLVDPGKLDKVLSASESDKAAVVLDALADVQSFAEPPAARIVGEQDIVPTGWSSETLTDGTPVIRVYDPSRFRDRLFLSALPDIVRDIQIARHVILDLRFQTRPTVVDIDPMLDFIRRFTPGADIAFRAHIGFASEERPDTGDYRSEWRQRRMPGSATVSIAAIINGNTPDLLPFVASARDGHLLLLTEEFDRKAKETQILGLPYAVVKVDGIRYRIRTATSLLALGPPTLMQAGTTVAEISKRLRSGAERTTVVPVRLPGAPHIPQLPDSSSTSTRLLRAQVIVAGLHPHRCMPWRVIGLDTSPRDTPGARLYTAIKQVAVTLEDGHAQVLYRPLADGGFVPAPLRLRVITGDLTVVQRYGLPPIEAGIELGDVIETINGVRWPKVAKAIYADLSFSTPWAHTLYMCNRILAGPAGAIIRLGILRGGKRLIVELPRVMTVAADGRVHERLGAPARMLAGNVGYLDLDNLTQAGVSKALDIVGAAGKWIIDARGQGNMVAWDLAPQLATKRTVAGVCVTRVDIADVGALEEQQLRRRELVIEPAKGARRRKVVVLVDERTQSQSEISALFFKALGAILVGSRTAGTVGDVTDIQVHPEVRMSFSGQDVLTNQRVSLHGRVLYIDVLLKETSAAIRSGRDLPLEAALKILAKP